jgi:hypothetical protein
LAEADEMTRLWRQAESWRDEGVRLNREVHELRRRIDTIQRESLAPLVRGLLRVLSELKPLLRFVDNDPRRAALELDVKNVEDLAASQLKLVEADRAVKEPG